MTTIQWTDFTWNPVRGCSVVSPGCTNCYAMKQAHRFSTGWYAGLTKLTNCGPVWTGDVRLVPEKLDEPLRWRKPRRIFVNSMSDLFHEKVPDEFILAVLGVAALAPQHTFQILTKRPERMREVIGCFTGLEDAAVKACVGNALNRIGVRSVCHVDWTWPIRNVWLGTSCEDQARADERIPLLLQTPAAVRFLSVEPLLGPVVLWRLKNDPTLGANARGPDWVIVGGESGPGARPCDVAWIRSLVEQCKAAMVPVFCKQLGSFPCAYREVGTAKGGCLVPIELRHRKGGDPTEWPTDLRVREFPKTEAKP